MHGLNYQSGSLLVAILNNDNDIIIIIHFRNFTQRVDSCQMYTFVSVNIEYYYFKIPIPIAIPRRLTVCHKIQRCVSENRRIAAQRVPAGFLGSRRLSVCF